MATKTSNPALGMLRYHVTGAIERGEAEAVVEQPLPEVPEPFIELMTHTVYDAWVAQLRAYATEAVRLHVEAVEDRAESLLRRLDDWGRAYPEDVFSEPTEDERAWLQAEHRGLQDRIAASMGRHMARMIEQDLAALRALLTQPEQNNER